MKRLSRRARRLLALALSLAVIASLAVFAAHRQAHAAAAPVSAAAPGSAQSRADLIQMQAMLNSGSVSRQAALLAPPLQFAPGSGPIVPPGKTIRIEPGTLRSDGQYGLVEARVSDGTTVTLGLYAVQGHWRLYAVEKGTVKVSASVTPQPGGPARAQLVSYTGSGNPCPTKTQVGKSTPVILIHGYTGHPSDWGPDNDPSSMYFNINAMHGTWVTTFDYHNDAERWVTEEQIGPAFSNYIACVAQASKDGKGNGKVIIVAHSMGGLATRYAATTGQQAGNIAMLITLGTPNTGSFMADAGNQAVKWLLCPASKYGLKFLDRYGFCTRWQSLAGMSVFGSDIAKLPELPSSIPLYAAAGDETYVNPLWYATTYVPLFGDGIVLKSSALHAHPGGGPGATKVFPCTALINPMGSCWHGALPNNQGIEQWVRGIISAYIQSHPAPVTAAVPAGTCPPAFFGSGPPGNSQDAAAGIVYKYVQLLNSQDFQDAWNMGGSVLSGGVGYDAWVAGYAGTAKTTVQAADDGGGKVSAYLTVLQDGATTQYFHGYYDVDTASGMITGASIQQDCETGAAQGPGSAPGNALAPGSTAYWLAHGGQWFVHGMQIQISQGSSGLVGTMSWNAGGNVWTGTAHLAFTRQPGGVLTGTFTDNAAYAQTGSDTSSIPQPDPGGPQQGQTITLVPVSPMLAKIATDSSSPAMFAAGNTNLCQNGLPNISSYCGA